jgi:hypothetical protein
VQSAPPAESADPALAWGYLLSANPVKSPYGPLSTMQCVCGCGGDDTTEGTAERTTVRCSFVGDSVRVCVLTNALFYGEERPTVPGITSRIPVVLAVCDVESKYTGLFDARAGKRFWRSHVAFGGVKFDHVSEWRLAQMPPTIVCAGVAVGQGLLAGCALPGALQWGGSQRRGPGNGWMPDWSAPTRTWAGVARAPQLNQSHVAFLDSADCWCHDFQRVNSMNPWHCKASILNWNVLSALFNRRPSLLGLPSFSAQNATLFALQGYDEFFPNRPLVGWYDLEAAAGGGLVFDFHDDDHALREALRKSATRSNEYRVVLQGRLPTAVTNAPPDLSPLWRAVGGFDSRGPSNVLAQYRQDLVGVITTALVDAASAEHPVDTLLGLTGSVRLIDAGDGASRTDRGGADNADPVQPLLATDRDAWTKDRRSWRLAVLGDLAVVVRRSPHGTDFADNAVCGRCLTNIDTLATAVAKATGMHVLLVHLTGAIPSALQAYLFMAARLVVGMHGGAWGGAIGMSPMQAAVEVVVSSTDTVSAVQIVRPTGAVYAQSVCLGCDGNTARSGEADIVDVVAKVRGVLALGIQ